MENVTKSVADSNATLAITFDELVARIESTMNDTVVAESSERTLSSDITAYCGGSWYKISGAEIQKATADDTDPLAFKLKAVQKKVYDTLHVKTKAKAKANGDAKWKDVKHSNPSAVWDRLKRYAKEQAEGGGRLGVTKSYTYCDRAIKVLVPIWNQIARATEPTVDDIKFQKELGAFIKKHAGKEAKHIDVTELGTVVKK